ncbi:MAG: fabG 6 [Mycobacterium sp.]|jgi:NAD(P)-dependent dehydrogenase (short-subunit alcohol dehydrogenase family)|nr:fabG 6 [Mycobacterium sp.]
MFLTSPETEFAGKRALITGGTRGIGRGIANRLLAGGASVAVAARSVPDDAGGLVVIEADVSTADGVTSLGRQALERLGGIDFVVHNVGGSTQSPGGSTTVTDDEWQHAFDSNLFTAVRLDRVLVPQMLEQGSGGIVHITSIQRRTPLPASLPYAAAKAALANYSKALANELAPNGIRVNAVAPGYIETEAAHRMAVETAELDDTDVATARRKIMDSIGGIPLGHPGRPQDIGELVAFLLSERAAYLVGAEFVADGGSIRTV